VSDRGQLHRRCLRCRQCAHRGRSTTGICKRSLQAGRAATRQLPAVAKGVHLRSKLTERKSRRGAGEGRVGGTDVHLLAVRARKAPVGPRHCYRLQRRCKILLAISGHERLASARWAWSAHVFWATTCRQVHAQGLEWLVAELWLQGRSVPCQFRIKSTFSLCAT